MGKLFAFPSNRATNNTLLTASSMPLVASRMIQKAIMAETRKVTRAQNAGRYMLFVEDSISICERVSRMEMKSSDGRNTLKIARDQDDDDCKVSTCFFARYAPNEHKVSN